MIRRLKFQAKPMLLQSNKKCENINAIEEEIVDNLQGTNNDLTPNEPQVFI